MCDHMEIEVVESKDKDYWEGDMYTRREIHTCRCTACDCTFVVDEDADLL